MTMNQNTFFRLALSLCARLVPLSDRGGALAEDETCRPGHNSASRLSQLYFFHLRGRDLPGEFENRAGHYHTTTSSGEPSNAERLSQVVYYTKMIPVDRVCIR